jgi:hypothetical protein
VAGLAGLALFEARHSGRSVKGLAPLLRAELFRVPAFAAGMGIQLAFFAGMQGFFLAFALWLQAGERFSPLKAGLTAVAFSVGSFVAAPGAGLALLVIPLVNVVLAAVPAEVAGGASGLFSTAQQLGGALGVALLGTVFFGYLNRHSFEGALVHTAPYAMGAFALCGVLSLLLPRTAVSEEAPTESWPPGGRGRRPRRSCGGRRAVVG